MKRQSLRIVQLTDTHILPDSGTKLGGVDTTAALDSILRMIQADDWSPDLILATGDLSQDGSPASYRRLRSSLGTVNALVYCVPGNHDDREQMAQHLECDFIRTERYFTRGSWQIFLLDSKVQGEDRGHLRDDDFRFLDRTLGENRHLHALIGLHHNPSPICPMPMCGLDNAEEFLQCLSRHRNALCVISGHAHCTADERSGSIRLLTSPSTCLFAEHPHGPEIPQEDRFLDVHAFDPNRRGFRRLELYPNGDVVTEVIWDEGRL